MQIRGILLSLFVLLISGCVQVPDSPAFKPSTKMPEYNQSSFEQYVRESRAWLAENRAFITEDKAREIDANAPFELKPEKASKKKKGILLVHGLGDSPYSFVDIAPMLAKQGFLVRVILLPGHGSKPADLIWPEMEDWMGAVKHHTRLLQSEVDEVWLGGFSTGGNLVTSLALEDESIKGLVLFSPGFVPKSKLVALAPVLARIQDWADIDPTDNFARYDSLAVNGAGEYYKTSKEVRNGLKKQAFDRPVLVAMSEGDSVIDPHGVVKLFEQRFTHPDSRLIWYGNDPGSKDDRVEVLEARIPELRISSFSHMAALFAPENPYYGKGGEYRMCNNGQGDLEAECPTEENLWYSGWGYREEGKIHARLTWNPYFEDLKSEMSRLMD